MDICTRTLLPASDTFLGIAATGVLVSLVTRVALGLTFQVVTSVLYFFLCWALAVAGTLTVLLPLGTCQLAILINYMQDGAAQSLGASFANVAILLSVSAAALSACLGAWDAVAGRVGRKEDLRALNDGHWLAPVVLFSVEAAEKCREGMELPAGPQTAWARLFWLWPRFVHNHVRGFRRLGRWTAAYEIKRRRAAAPQRVVNIGGEGERAPLLPRPVVQGDDDDDDTDVRASPTS